MTDIQITEAEREKLDATNLRAPLMDWLVTTRMLLEAIAVLEAFVEKAPQLVRQTPRGYLQYARERIARLDAVLADAEARAAPTTPEGEDVATAVRAQAARVRQAARERLDQQLAGMDPDAATNTPPDDGPAPLTGQYL